jgi:hypothetical protein
MSMQHRIEARRNTPERNTSDRSRSDTGSNWFRLGVLSATVIAPLIARWNDLRTSSNPQTLRELAALRLDDARSARDQAAAQLAPVRAAANARLDDVRAAARPRVDDALERLAQVRTPEVLKNLLPFSLATKRVEELERQRQRRRRQTTLRWLAGVGMMAAGATAYMLARRWMTMPVVDEEPMVELPMRNLDEVTVGKAPGIPGVPRASSMRNA